MIELYLILEIFSLQGDSLVLNYYDNDPIEVSVHLTDSTFSFTGLAIIPVNKLDSIEGDFTEYYKGDSINIWKNPDKILVTTGEFIYLLEPKHASEGPNLR